MQRSGWRFLGLALLAAAAAGHAWAEAPAEQGRLHHIHLNVSSAARTQAFYAHTLGAAAFRFRGRVPALQADDGLLLLNEVAFPIRPAVLTGVYHLGWGRLDGLAEFEKLKVDGVAIHTPATAFMGGHFMYFHGPDREVIEIWTANKDHRLNHVHLLSPDPKTTAAWFAKVANPASAATPIQGLPAAWTLRFDAITLDVLPDVGPLRPKERTGPIEPTDGAGIDHLAFAFRDLQAARRRIEATGISLERPTSVDRATGLKHFFVRSPDGVLVEVVEDREAGPSRAR